MHAQLLLGAVRYVCAALLQHFKREWQLTDKEGRIMDPSTIFDDHPFVGVDYVTTGNIYRFSSGTTLQRGDLVSAAWSVASCSVVRGRFSMLALHPA